MRRLHSIAILVLILFLFQNCPLNQGDEEPEPEPLEFSTEASSALTVMIQETPSDFTWDFFGDNIIVSMNSDANWSGNLVLSVFQVRDGDVIDNITTDAVETNAGELDDGISTEILFPESELFPASEWLASAHWAPDKIFKLGDIEKTITDWAPAHKFSLDSHVSPSEVESATLDFNELEENETLIVVYAHAAGSDDREQITKPFGLVLGKKNAQ